MRTAKLKLTAVVAAGLLGLAGTGTVIALGQVPKVGAPGQPAPPAPEKAAPAPAVKFDPSFTAFPDVKPPDVRGRDYEAELAKKCPRLYGGEPVAVLPTDDTYRRLLKARLEQGRLEVVKIRQVIQVGRWTSADFATLIQIQDDMRAAAADLWADSPDTLIPWLEEFVVLAKEFERFTQARVEAGTDPPQALHTARRYRLKAESELWKVKAGVKNRG